MKDRLKALRSVLKITQIELADKANIGRSTYAMFETGDRIPKDIHISAICSVTGASENWLRNGTGEMFVPSDDSTIHQLVEQYHLRPMEKAILEAFVKLPETYRDGVLEYVKSIVSALVSQDSERVQSLIDQQAEEENQSLRDNPAFQLPVDHDGDEKAHA
jgi:transcriptional regulator with XRE-family HTH domain